MRFLIVETVLCLCLSTSFAAFTPIYKEQGGDYKKNGGSAQESPKLKAEESKIHLDSPKIILDRPSITVVRSGSQGARSTTHDNNIPVSYESDTPQYGPQQYGPQQQGTQQYGPQQYGPQQFGPQQYGTQQHGTPNYGNRPNYGISQPSVSTGPGSYIADFGHDFGRVPAPFPVPNRTPSTYDRLIYIRRPVLAREQIPTQDQHEIFNYPIPGLTQGFSVNEYGIPVPRGHNAQGYGGNRGPGYGYGPSNSQVYSGAGYGYGPSNTPAYNGAGYGQGPSNTPAYSAPVIIEPNPRTYNGNPGIAAGKFLVGEAVLHGHGGTVLHGIGGALLHGHGGPGQYDAPLNGAPLKKY